MRKNLLWYLLTISFTLLLTSGCAKDQVKPDEGIAGDTAAAAEATSGSQTTAQQQQAAAQKATLEQMAAQKAAQDKAAAQKSAQEQAAAEKAAKEQAAAQQAALERGTAQQLQTQQSAADSSTSAAAEAAKASLQKIHFDFDSYVLKQEARDTLYNDADYLLKKYRGKVRLEGHCDERGSDEYNLALGENRAKSAMNYLITLGVPAQQLSIISYGKERPLDTAQTEEAWAKNRRVEFELVK
jgi:peptidoglycan-associated lipoprotein